MTNTITMILYIPQHLVGSICSSEGLLLCAYLQGSICKQKDWTCPFENQSGHAVAQFCKGKESRHYVLCAREVATLLGPKSSCHWPCSIPGSPGIAAHRCLEALKVGMDGKDVRFCDKYWRSSSCALVPVGPVCAGDAAHHLLCRYRYWCGQPALEETHSITETSGRDSLLSACCLGTVRRWATLHTRSCHISTVWGIQQL